MWWPPNDPTLFWPPIRKSVSEFVTFGRKKGNHFFIFLLTKTPRVHRFPNETLKKVFLFSPSKVPLSPAKTPGIAKLSFQFSTLPLAYPICHLFPKVLGPILSLPPPLFLSHLPCPLSHGLITPKAATIKAVTKAGRVREKEKGKRE